ncbi:DUF3108 domain-containing protein [Fulvivirga lutea]|uniref:DUF3108 domain-containing protein n=1 Tax=Fulvivirga lutea TaxID=2810512 RepID=A0A974WKR5_9BACT|nr:DUF3108 domain-containing protein [Fulvivirga lutea]QSE99017.1 DUF3108 domain-containing protein [Fulvivirga lutea]
MKRGVILLIFISALLISSDQYKSYRSVPNTSFIPGEVINYKVHYGFVNAAEGKMVISDKLFKINNRHCYKIDVYGKSIGMFDVFLRIRDNWGTYLDTASIIPHKAYRYIEEGKYRKKEIVNFHHFNKKVEVIDFDKNKEIWKPAKEFEAPTYVQDMVSGYYYLRTLDFDKLKENEIIQLKAFFDDEVYDFNIRFLGREEVKTKIGTIRSLVLSPIMPENSLFDGENSIRVWISDDRNKVPIKVKAQMFVGAVEVDIQSYEKGDIK